MDELNHVHTCTYKAMYVHICHIHLCPCPCPWAPHDLPHAFIQRFKKNTRCFFLFFIFNKSFYFVYCMWHCHSPGSMLATPFGRTPPHPPFGNCLPTFPHWFPLSFVTWLFYERILAGDLFFVNLWSFRQECWEWMFDIDKGMHLMEYLSKICWIMWCFP